MSGPAINEGAHSMHGITVFFDNEWGW